jgi:UDP-glucose 4-epimerase
LEKNLKIRVLVTGGSGLLAGRINEFLKDKEINCKLLSRFSKIKKIKSSDIVFTDWKFNSLKKKVKDYDVVIHCAGLNANECQNDPKLANKINYLNSRKILDISIKNKVKLFIFISTVHVYKSPLLGKFDEYTNTINNHPYALTKRKFEKYLVKKSSGSKLKGLVVRLSNSFGKPINKLSNCWGLLVNDLCKNLHKTNTIILQSPKNSVRDFIPITSLNMFLYDIIKKILIDKIKINYSIVNFASGKSQTIFSLAKNISLVFKNISSKKAIIQKKFSNIQNKEICKISSKRINFKNYQNKKIFDNEISNLLIFCKKNF